MISATKKKELLTSFRMNEKREILFRQRIIKIECAGIEASAKRQWDMASMYYADASDMLHVLHLLSTAKSQEHIQKALDFARSRDTAAREQYPDFVWELAEYTLNWPNPGESLKETE
jgi:hypothetical protein